MSQNVSPALGLCLTLHRTTEHPMTLTSDSRQGLRLQTACSAKPNPTPRFIKNQNLTHREHITVCSHHWVEIPCRLIAGCCRSVRRILPMLFQRTLQAMIRACPLEAKKQHGQQSLAYTPAQSTLNHAPIKNRHKRRTHNSQSSCLEPWT